MVSPMPVHPPRLIDECKQFGCGHRGGGMALTSTGRLQSALTNLDQELSRG